MSRKWMKWINLALGASVIFILMVIGLLRLTMPDGVHVSKKINVSRPLPPAQFAFSSEIYAAMAEKLLNLNFAPPKLELPDLRNVILYYGTNTRPDADQETKPLFLGINGIAERMMAKAHEKVYLMFDRQLKPPTYTFSPDNKETPLWIEVEPEGDNIAVETKMVNENKELISVPAENRKFILKVEESPRFGNRRQNTWEIGKFRVDATLLARQKARWYGRDLFMEQHGGKEYADLASKERLDFLDDERPYSIYLGVNDSAVWKDDRWQEVKMGEDSRPYPLLQVKKIEDRLMTIDVWDPSGQNKFIMNLLKSREPWMPKRLEKEFKFITARTRTQYVFEIKGVRTTLKPQDWLLQTDHGWKRLSTVEEIDDYVNRKIVGPLFVFDGAVKTEEGQQVLRFHFYNSSRTEEERVEIPIQAANLTIIPPQGKEEKNPNIPHNIDYDGSEEEMFDESHMPSPNMRGDHPPRIPERI